jgi:hypothetical protein
MAVSYMTQQLSHGVYILCGGLIFTLLVCLPSWPIYNRQQLKWLKSNARKKEE